MKCIIDIDECNCSCHKSQTVGDLYEARVKHMMACCEVCPTCGKNIRVSAMYIHEQECARQEQHSPSAEFWEFVDRTAKRVEDWPQWKKEGWDVLDRKPNDRLT